MQVNQISIAIPNSLNRFTSYGNHPKKVNSEDIKTNNQISFSGIIGRDLVKRHCSVDPLKVLKNFKQDEYESLSSIQLSDLRTRYKKLEKEFPVELNNFGEMHSYAAECIRYMFDKNFGKGNYVVVPIGRSLSSISKALEMKIGSENVVNIPMSNAKRFYSKSIDLEDYKKFLKDVKNEKGFDEFLSFLKSKNLTRKDIEQSGKQYVLIDYCYSGESLSGAEKLFKSDLVWGNKNKNIHAVDFINILEHVDPVKLPNSSVPQEADKILFKFCSDLFCSNYKDYTTVDRAESFADTISASKLNPASISEKTKLVWFNIMDTSATKKGESTVKLVQLSDEEKMMNKLVEHQNIEDWHDSSTQYKSDLLDVSNEISKLFVFTENHKYRKTSPTKEMLTHLQGVQKYLKLCAENINDFSLMRNFYAIKSDIETMLVNVQDLLSK